MNTQRRLAGLGLICFVVFAIVTLPARIPLQWFGPEGFSAAGVRGTLWAGSAAAMSLPGLQLRSTEWDIAPMRLLRGQLGGTFTTRWDGGFAEGAAAAGITGALTLQDTTANMTARSLAAVAALPGVDGQVNLQIKNLKLTDKIPQQLIGTVRVQGLSSTLIGTGSAGLLGNVIAEFDSSQEQSDEVITGKIRDEGGPLELAGTLQLQQPDAYALKVLVTPRADASDSLRQSLQFLGSPDANGAYLFALTGTL